MTRGRRHTTVCVRNTVRCVIFVGTLLSLLVTGLIIKTELETNPDPNAKFNTNIYNIARRTGEKRANGGTNGQNQPRLLCWIMTSPSNLWTRAIHVKKTWGSRCDKTLYFSSIRDISFPAIGLNVSEGRRHLTVKSQLAFRYIYKHYLNEFDWFLKADDDTYVIVENLRYFLFHKNTSLPLYFGHHFKHIVEGGYASGGAGYILSKESLRRLVELGDNKVLCRQDGGSEDVEIGKCLHNLGVTIEGTYDSEGRSLFHCFDAATHILGAYPAWYKVYDAHGGKKGMRSMSKHVISFHYMKPESMYVFHYLLYHVTVHD